MKDNVIVFDNIDRNRYYGLRVGDIIDCKAYDITGATVVAYTLDNNAVWVKVDGQERMVVAEWCTIVKKV